MYFINITHSLNAIPNTLKDLQTSIEYNFLLNSKFDNSLFLVTKQKRPIGTTQKW